MLSKPNLVEVYVNKSRTFYKYSISNSLFQILILFVFTQSRHRVDFEGKCVFRVWY